MSPTVGGLFSGIGGFALAFQRAGFTPRWECEIDPAARNVLAQHWPDVPCYGDITAVDPSDLAPVDVITFGSPCQDLSVAGKRAGLEGARSGLFYEAIRIIRAVRPAFAVWENVPGALSSAAGRDFGCVLDALADAGALDIGWRVLDAQWFGVAQRRRRVFLVADFRGQRTAEILFESESGERHSAPRRETGARTAPCLTNGLGKSSGQDLSADNQVVGANQTTGFHGEAVVAPCLTRRYGKGTDSDATDALVYQSTPRGDVNALGTLRAGGRSAGNGAPFVTHSLRAEGCDASEDGTGRGVPLVVQASEYGVQTSDTAPTLRADRQSGGEYAVSWLDTHPTLAAATGGPSSQDWQARAAALHGPAVRRLTPLECCRLQGFPDDWLDSIGLADTAKYRMLGNAVCVNVVEWLAQRLYAALEASA